MALNSYSTEQALEAKNSETFCGSWIYKFKVLSYAKIQMKMQ